jgi:hypothetical protein
MKSSLRHPSLANIAALIVTGLIGSAQQPTAEIQGQLVDDAQLPVANARVRVVRTAQPALTAAESVTAANGGFSITGLSAGDYQICVEIAGRELLNPCLWQPKPIPVRLDASQRLTGVQVRLKKPVPLTVRVDDPAQLLSSYERSPAGGPLLIGIWSANGLFHPARVVSQDAQGRNYTLLAPSETSLHLSVNGHKIQLLDENGQPFNSNPPIALKIDRTATEKYFRFSVAGVGQ